MITDTLPETAPPRSPWLTMWLSPRVTIVRILRAESRPSWIPVVALVALHAALERLSVHYPFDTFAALLGGLMAALVFGSLQLVYGILIGPFLLAIVGGWLGGDADASDIRQGAAWGYVPIAVATVLWLPIIATLGWEAFNPHLVPDSPVQWGVVSLRLVMFLALLWSMLLQVATLAAVQRFTIPRALANSLIPAIPVILLEVAL